MRGRYSFACTIYRGVIDTDRSPDAEIQEKRKRKRKKCVLKCNHHPWQDTITTCLLPLYTACASCLCSPADRSLARVRACACVSEGTVCRMWFTLVFTLTIHECTQTEMMHKQSRDYTEDLWGLLSIKIQKTNTNIHQLMHHLNMLHWLRAHPQSLSAGVRDGGERKEKKRRKTSSESSGVMSYNALRFVSKLSEWAQVWASQWTGKENWICFYFLLFPLKMTLICRCAECGTKIGRGESKAVGKQRLKLRLWSRGTVATSSCPPQADRRKRNSTSESQEQGNGVDD